MTVDKPEVFCYNGLVLTTTSAIPLSTRAYIVLTVLDPKVSVGYAFGASIINMNTSFLITIGDIIYSFFTL